MSVNILQIHYTVSSIAHHYSRITTFYRGERMTVIGAISQEKVIAFDIIGKSMKGEDFIAFFIIVRYVLGDEMMGKKGYHNNSNE